MNFSLFDETKSVFETYHKFKDILVRNNTVSFKNQAYLFVRDVELTYFALSKYDQIYLKQEFLLLERAKWWREFYSINQYYNLRNRACKNFMEKFYEIH